MKVIIPCYCGHKFDYEYADEVEITPDVFSDITNGDFMTVVCEKCGKDIKPEYPVMFTYPSSEKHIKIFFVPELQRDSFLMGKSQYIHKSTDRFVIGYMELVEKIKILAANLDDINIECVKYYILSKIENENNIENEILIYFGELEDNKITFHIHGLREGEVGLLDIEMNFYEMISEKLKDLINDEPFKNFLTPPYISVMKIYREYSDTEPAFDNQPEK